MASCVVRAVSYDVLWYYSAPMARPSRATPPSSRVFPSPPMRDWRLNAPTPQFPSPSPAIAAVVSSCCFRVARRS